MAFNTLPIHTDVYRVDAQQRRAGLTWWLWFLLITGISALLGLRMLRSGPDAALIAWLVYLIGVVAIIYQPRFGIYLTLLFGLIADTRLSAWYPFLKNFSARESIFFVHDQLIINGAELYLVLTAVSWLGRGLMQRKVVFYRGPLFWPTMAFLAFISYGVIYGLVIRNGNVNIGLWEARAMFYLPLMIMLASNLIQRREHVTTVLWCATIGIFIDSLAGIAFVHNTLNWDIAAVDKIQDHAASIHANTVFLFLVGMLMFRVAYRQRLALLLVLPTIAIAYLANQRRSAYLTLGIALLLVMVLLYFERPRAFWFIAPLVSLFGLAYLAVFWNASGLLALPASAVKSVLAPDGASEDYQSNLYRIIENINTMYTIKAAPLQGVGFGQKFFIVRRMPDISHFVWWEYMTHNSIMWMWMKTGLGGFLAMLLLIGAAIINGVRCIFRMPGDMMSVAALVATLYVVMHFIYAYVDISWDSQSMIYMGTMMGLINCLERIVDTPVPLGERRWPWQPYPQAQPGLRPH